MNRYKSRKRPVIIVHFQPLESYPPVMNFIRFIEASYGDYPVEIITTKPASSVASVFKTGKQSLLIRRFGIINSQQPVLFRLFNYFIFYANAFCRILIARPSKIMYYESLSAYPVYLYRKYINSEASVFIHYHEYVSKDEYADGMKLVRFFHHREHFLYRVARWISHTNEERMRFFLEDEALKPDRRFNILPNYPPHSWLTKPADSWQYPLKIVYAGAISTETMFTLELAKWVMQQNGRVKWDIYSNNISPDAASFFKQLETDCICLKGGVDYYSLPSILQQYQAGVILYKGHIPNYVYNAPNKLFEYLSAGLDVWVPAEMIGCRVYYTSGTYPRVLPVDFKQLQFFDWQGAVQKDDLHYQPSPWFYEQVYSAIGNALFEDE